VNRIRAETPDRSDCSSALTPPGAHPVKRFGGTASAHPERRSPINSERWVRGVVVFRSDQNDQRVSPYPIHPSSLMQAGRDAITATVSRELVPIGATASHLRRSAASIAAACLARRRLIASSSCQKRHERVVAPVEVVAEISSPSHRIVERRE